MTEENSSVGAKKATLIGSSDNIVPPDDDDAMHSRHTFSSRQKMQEAARKRNKNGARSKKQQHNNNGVGIISPLPDETSARQAEAWKSNNNGGNSDMQWSTIGNTKLPATQELDKLASLIPQPVSPECSVEEIDEAEQQIVAAVSPEVSSPPLVSNQKKQLLHSNFKTPKKTPTCYRNNHAESHEEETPITDLFNYYDFPNKSSKENNKSMSPTTSSMLQTSPFILSGKLLDDQLQSVLEADLSMERKIEQMEKDLDDSYMGSPMSGHLNVSRGSDDDDSVDDNINDEVGESMSTISDAVSAISDDRNVQSPITKADAEFLTPKSRLVHKTRGQRTTGTAYYTARNFGGRENARGCDEERRMYDSDSESYSVRRMVVKQQQRRPRSASYDTLSNSVNTATHVKRGKVRRNSMSPPAEFRTTRVLWRHDTAPMGVASLNWEFDAEEKQSDCKGALSSVTKNEQQQQLIDAEKPQTPLFHLAKMQHDVDESDPSTHTVPTQLPKTLSTKKDILDLGRVSEEQGSEAFKSASQVLSDRDKLLNAVNEMRIQLTQLEGERDSLVAERDEQAKDCSMYKMEMKALTMQIKTLEEEVMVSHQVVENVKETLSLKTDETDCLKQLLRKRDEEMNSMKFTLVSKEGKVEELLLTLNEKEVEFEARLQSAENAQQEEVARVTAEMKQRHVEAAAKLECDLKEAHASELDLLKAALTKGFEEKCGELMAAHDAQVEQMKVSSSEEVALVRSETEKDYLAAIDSMTMNHSQEIATIMKKTNASQLEALDELKSAHEIEVKLLEDRARELNTEAEKLKEENEGLARKLDTQEEEHRQSQVAHSEVQAIAREENKVLEERVASLTKSLKAKSINLDMVVDEKVTIQAEMERQLADSQTEIDTLTLANSALLEDCSSLKESNETLTEANATLQASLHEASENMSLLRKEREELTTSLEDATCSLKVLEDRIASVDSDLDLERRRNEELSTENKDIARRENELSTQIKTLQKQIQSSNDEKVKMAAELDALACLETEIREQLECSDDENTYLREEFTRLQSQLFEAKRDRDSTRDEMARNNQASKRRISDLESENRALTRVKNILQLKSDKIESLNASAKVELEEGNKKMTELREECDTSKAELVQVESKLQFEIERTASLAAEKADVELNLKSTQSELDSLQGRLDETLSSFETMRSSLENAHLQIQLKSDEIASLTVSSNEKLDEMHKTMSIHREENVATKAELEELQSQLKSESTKMANVLSEKSSIEVKLSATQREFDEALVSCESMLLSLEDARKQIQEHSSEIDRLRASAALEREELSTKIDILTTENIATKAELELLRSEKCMLDVHLAASLEDRDDLQQRFDGALVSCESLLLCLEDARSQMQGQLSQMDSLNASAAAERDDVNKVVVALKEQKSGIEAQLKTMLQERDDLQHKFDEALISCESMLLSLQDARSQMLAQTIEIESLNATAASDRAKTSEVIESLLEDKCGAENALNSCQADRDDLQQRFNEALISCESLLLSLEDARSHVQEVEVQLVAKDETCANELSQKAEAMTSLARIQAVAAKLAVYVLQLKHKSKNEQERNEELTTEVESKNERIVFLESCLDEFRNGPVVERNLKSTVSKLALALIKLKARERHALAVQQTLSSKNIELVAELGVMAKENEGMVEGMSVLADKNNALELDSGSNQSTITELQKAVSEKDAEVRRLNVLLAGKDDVLKDVTNEMNTIRMDVMNGVKKLEIEHASAKKACAHLEEERDGLSAQLNRERDLVFDLQSQLQQVISEKNEIEDDFVDLQGTHLRLENQFEQVSQDRIHLKTQLEEMHDNISAFEADKDSLTMKLEESQEQVENLSQRIASLEADAKSNATQIDYMEFQLVAKMDESEALSNMVVSHEATMKELNDELEAMDAKRIETEDTLSSLRSKMDEVINERDDLVSQLQSAIKETQSVRAERESARLVPRSSPPSTPSSVDSSQEIDDFASSPGQGIRRILESSTISKEDIDFICSNMDKSKTVLTKIGKERRLLKKEVKRLRAELEEAHGELKTAKKNCKVMNQQTISLRGDVNQAKTLLKECEAEKNQLASDLEAAHEAMEQIQKCSKESYADLVQQSQHKISMLKNELESKNEAIEQLNTLRSDHISNFDITSDSIPSQQPTVVTSSERFKVEKGQSMFGILRGKRSKRKGKDQLSYRKQK